MLDTWYEQLAAVLMAAVVGLGALRLITKALGRLAKLTPTKKDDEALEIVDATLGQAQNQMARLVANRAVTHPEDDDLKELRDLYERFIQIEGQARKKRENES